MSPTTNNLRLDIFASAPFIQDIFPLRSGSSDLSDLVHKSRSYLTDKSLNNQSMGNDCNTSKGSVNDSKWSPFISQILLSERGTLDVIDTPLIGVAVFTLTLAVEAIRVSEEGNATIILPNCG